MSDDLGTARLQTEVDLAGLAKGLDDAEGQTKGRLASMADGMKGMLGLAFAGAGVAVAGGLVTAVNAAGDFEAAVNNLAAVSGTALADAGFAFDDVSQKALELGQSTAFSASQSIAAMTELVKGGVPVTEVMGDATEATLNLASAGQLELATAAEIVSKQLGVWADQGITATQVSDLLAQAANASTVGVEELAAGLANAQGTAETAGVEYQDLVQTMALLAPNFASAETAGSSLNNFLLRLQPTTGPATIAMDELGLMTFNTTKAMDALRAEGIDPTGMSARDLQTSLFSLGLEMGMSQEKADEFVHSFDTSVFYDMEGNFVGMEQAAELLQGSLEGLSEAEKTMALQTIFGNDAMGAAVALGAAGAEGFNAMGEAMTGAGTAASVAAVQNQGLNFAMDSLMGAVETFSIILGTILVPYLTAFINDALIPAVGWVTSFAQSLASNQEAAGGLMTALQPIIDALQANMGPVIAGVAGIIAAMLVPAIWSAVAAFGAALIAAGPIIAIFAAVGLAAAALYAAWQNNFGGIREATDQAMAAISGVIQQVMGVVLTFWQNNGASIMAAAQSAWTSIQGIIGGIVTIIQIVVTTVFGAIAGFLSEHGDEIQGVLTFVWNTIWTIIDTTLKNIQGVVNTVLAVLQGDWGRAWSEIQGIFDRSIKAVQSILGNVLGAIQGLWTSALGSIQSKAREVWDSIRSTVQGAIDGVKGAISSALSSAQSSAAGAWDGMLGKARDTVNSMKSAVSDTLNGLAGIVRDKISEAAGTVEGLAGRFASAGRAIINSLRDGIMNTINQLIEDAKKKLKELVDLLPGSEPRDRSSPLYGLGRRGEAFVENFAAGMDGAWASLDMRPALAGLAGQLGALELAGASASASVQIGVRDSALAKVIDVRVDEKMGQAGRTAKDRRSTR